jgi:peptidoglycan hydrolase CwlO-like protein
MLAFLKKIPLWAYIAILVAILFLWQSISGFAYSNKLWNMVKNQIVTDQTDIINELEKADAIAQKEKEDLYKQINKLQQQRADLQREKEDLRLEAKRLKDELDKIVIPADPSSLVDLLHRYGLPSARSGRR